MPAVIVQNQRFENIQQSGEFKYSSFNISDTRNNFISSLHYNDVAGRSAADLVGLYVI
jgi:hypothetical protein